MRTWRLLLVGFGTVGRGVAERLRDGVEDLAVAGVDARLVGVIDPLVGSVADPGGLDPGALLALAESGESLADLEGGRDPGDLAAALEELDVDVVAELTPTDLSSGEPGIRHIRTALEAGCHVSTTNKGPVALAWPELQRLAGRRGVQLRCEGTVLSGTPTLNLFEAGLVGSGVRAVRGILNGTCNFILTEMEAGSSYDDALAEAQRRGYAEAEPAGDVEGWDAAAKVAILANRVLGAGLVLDDVERRGIVDLEADDVAAAPRDGHHWRLVGSVRRSSDGAWIAGVRPERLAASDPLAAVTGPRNLVAFETDALGTVTISGPGAGRAATGHAVIADLVAIHRTTAA